MSVSAITSMASIVGSGGASPISPVRAVARVARKKSSATGRAEPEEGAHPRGVLGASVSPAASSSAAVLSAMIGLPNGG